LPLIRLYRRPGMVGPHLVSHWIQLVMLSHLLGRLLKHSLFLGEPIG